MGYINDINSLKLDVLREIGNIGAGHAATSLSKLLNKKIDMKVPDVQIVTFDEMMEMAGGADNIVAGVFLRIEGDVPGSMFFILPLEQATKLVQDMIGDPSVNLAKPPYDELSMSALQELGNILSGSYLSSLSDFTKLSLYPSVPALAIDMVGAIVTYGLVEHSQVSDYAIVINTELNGEEITLADTVNGHFFLLPDPDSFAALFQSLGVKDGD
ncbi:MULTISPECIES: chemotaxis protein CheC [Niallia]|jgi:chemotaxis protein CheC|uniref:CheY-P-specific phosphatase CheC n=1 Tax=Niallia circulans TaxID=1397 RepID=A0A268FFV5_NIACI|nr:chemotaxis protein CheC [Niallia circulans]AYV66033.1 chemotaxis protein CheC [Niallia circulans]AYV71148.1 chemotaxis protein CheC [Niallia circulans]NRG28669.1 chemotaxis protein CheC [Niallia circulans]PAD84261.1 CheY-P-specific phosphatase CheC [Niallia circulans]QJX61928.1 chemotaxis protein CheC [Niallia circulans]